MAYVPDRGHMSASRMFDILICTLVDGFSLALCKFSNSVAKTLVIVPRAPPQTLTRLEDP